LAFVSFSDDWKVRRTVRRFLRLPPRTKRLRVDKSSRIFGNPSGRRLLCRERSWTQPNLSKLGGWRTFGHQWDTAAKVEIVRSNAVHGSMRASLVVWTSVIRSRARRAYRCCFSVESLQQNFHATGQNGRSSLRVLRVISPRNWQRRLYLSSSWCQDVLSPSRGTEVVGCTRQALELLSW